MGIFSLPDTLATVYPGRPGFVCLWDSSAVNIIIYNLLHKTVPLFDDSFITFSRYSITIYKIQELPCIPVVKNLSSNAEDVGASPGQGTRIPHAAGQLSPPTATKDATMKIPHATTKTQQNQKINKQNKNFKHIYKIQIEKYTYPKYKAQ